MENETGLIGKKENQWHLFGNKQTNTELNLNYKHFLLLEEQAAF